MRFLYFFLTSSLIIGFVLLFRRIFRKKLSAGVIYALWLLPLIKLLIPFASWEVPVFGPVAEFINRPIDIAEASYDEPTSDALAVYEETSRNNITSTQNEPPSNGIKVYDAVIPNKPTAEQIMKPTESLINEEQNHNYELSTKMILLCIWLSDSLALTIYTFIQNRKLCKKTDTLESVAKIDGIDVCVSKNMKTPCLVGVHSPRIIVTEEVFKSPELYKCAIAHELGHFAHKDNLTLDVLEILIPMMMETERLWYLWMTKNIIFSITKISGFMFMNDYVW